MITSQSAWQDIQQVSIYFQKSKIISSKRLILKMVTLFNPFHHTTETEEGLFQVFLSQNLIIIISGHPEATEYEEDLYHLKEKV